MAVAKGGTVAVAKAGATSAETIGGAVAVAKGGATSAETKGGAVAVAVAKGGAVAPGSVQTTPQLR